MHSDKSFNKFAAEKILEYIIVNKAGNLELNKELTEEIYQLASERADEIYPEFPGIYPPEGMVFIPPGEFIMGGSRLGNELLIVAKVMSYLRRRERGL